LHRHAANVVAFLPLLLAPLPGCSDRASVAPAPSPAEAQSPPSPPAPVSRLTLRIGALSAASEALEKRILPGFREEWARSRGQELAFETVYQGSHGLAHDIAGGFDADVAVVSIATDLDEIAEAGKIRGEWRTRPHGGVFSRSAIVLAVRKGNPHGIRDWSDLLRPDLGVVLPDPQVSGTGRSAVCAIHGAALRGYGGVGAGDPETAAGFLSAVLKRVVPSAPSARESFKRFEEGAGDVAITVESEVIRGRMFGHEYERVIPRSTLLMEYFAAVVDANAEAHGVREAAEAFVESLWSSPSQMALAFYGIRPVDEALAEKQAALYPLAEDVWTIRELGGWERVSREYFDSGGILERASEPCRRGH
jgi:sulfate/thiosulfate transport system substrate-binding protein